MNKLGIIISSSYIVYLLAVLLIARPQSVIFRPITDSEVISINNRRSYHNFAGQLFENKFTLRFDLLKRNLFEGLDANRYFFASHPRERAGVNEYFFLPFILMPLVAIGMFSKNDFSKAGWYLFIVTLAVISIFSSRHDFVIALMYWPIILFVIGGVCGLKRSS